MLDLPRFDFLLILAREKKPTLKLEGFIDFWTTERNQTACKIRDICNS